MARRGARSLEVARRVAAALFWVALGTLSILALVPTALPHVLPWLAQRHGVDLAVGRASYTLPGPDLRLEGLRVSGPEGPLELRDLRVGVDFGALRRGDLRLSRVSLEGGRLTLERTAAGTRLRLTDTLTLPLTPVDELEVADLTIAYAPAALPPVRLGSGRLVRLASTGADQGWELEAEGTLGDGSFNLSAELRQGADALEAQGQVAFRRIDLTALRALTDPALPGLGQGSAGGDLQGRVAGERGGPWVVEAEGRLEVDGLDLRATGREASDVRGRWEGRGILELPAGAPAGVRVSGRLDLDRATLAWTPSGGVLAVRGARLEGQASGPDEAGAWALDGDAQAASVEVRDGPWAGLGLTDVSLWGLWHGGGGELSVGQLWAAQGELRPVGERVGQPLPADASVRLQALDVRGISWGDEGLTLDRLGTGPVSIGWTDGPDPARIEALAVTEIVVSPALSRAGTVELTGLSLPGPGGEAGLEAARLTTLGLQAARGEPPRLGEVRGNGVRLRLARGMDGRWRLPALPQGPEVAFTLDSALVGNGSELIITDRAVDPPIRVALDGVEARLSAWDPTHPGHFSVRAAHAGGGSLELAGELGRWPKASSGPVQARFSAVPLTLFAGYARTWLGTEPVAGRVDGQLDLRAPGGEAQGRLTLVLSAVELAAPDLASGRADPMLRALRLIAGPHGRSELVVTLEPGTALGAEVAGAVQAAATRACRGLGLDGTAVAHLLRAGSVALPSVHPRGDPPVLPAEETARLDRLAAGLRQCPALGVRLCPGEAQVLPGGEDSGAQGLGAEDARGPTGREALEAVRRQLLAGDGIGAARIATCAGYRADALAGPIELGLEFLP